MLNLKFDKLNFQKIFSTMFVLIAKHRIAKQKGDNKKRGKREKRKKEEQIVQQISIPSCRCSTVKKAISR